jgi:hypothetical protein
VTSRDPVVSRWSWSATLAVMHTVSATTSLPYEQVEQATADLRPSCAASCSADWKGNTGVVDSPEPSLANAAGQWIFGQRIWRHCGGASLAAG